MTNGCDGFSSKLDMAKERKVSLKICQQKLPKPKFKEKKIMKKMEQTMQDRKQICKTYETILLGVTNMHIGNIRRRKRRKNRRNLLSNNG